MTGGCDCNGCDCTNCDCGGCDCGACDCNGCDCGDICNCIGECLGAIICGCLDWWY